MAVTASTELALGIRVPEFCLPECRGGVVSLADFEDKRALVVMFICNHCPFVRHIRHELARVANDYMSKNVGFVAINANDWIAFPDDSPARMAEEAETYGYPFPYLYDKRQDVAKAFSAACTPDIYVFDGARELVYHGQLDDSRPGNTKPLSGHDLRAALEAVLAGDPPLEHQVPSIGCNIKWRPGNEPDYG